MFYLNSKPFTLVNTYAAQPLGFYSTEKNYFMCESMERREIIPSSPPDISLIHLENMFSLINGFFNKQLHPLSTLSHGLTTEQFLPCSKRKMLIHQFLCGIATMQLCRIPVMRYGLLNISVNTLVVTLSCYGMAIRLM